MRHWLRCRLAPGQFDTEFAASGQQVNGKSFSLFVPIDQVQYEQAPPPRGHSVGWLPVEVWKQQGDQVLVQLPQPTLEDGYFVTVTADQVVPCGAPGPRLPGLHAGAIQTTPDFDAPLPDDFWAGQQ